MLWEENSVMGEKSIMGGGKSAMGEKSVMGRKWMKKTFWQRPPPTTRCAGLIFRSKQKVAKRQIQNFLSIRYHRRAIIDNGPKVLS